jgi:hypothetical protein
MCRSHNGQFLFRQIQSNANQQFVSIRCTPSFE